MKFHIPQWTLFSSRSCCPTKSWWGHPGLRP